MNLQQYVFNSPNNYRDPHGLMVSGGVPIEFLPTRTYINTGNTGNSGGDGSIIIGPIKIDLSPVPRGNGGGFMPGEIGPRYQCMDEQDEKPDNGDVFSKNGETDATKEGREKHKELAEKVKKKEGWQSEPTIKDKNGKSHKPDIITPSGRVIELKPNTKSGRYRGQKQLERYKDVLNNGKRGRVIYY